ncbi:Beta-1,4-galactosyltransferase 4,Beta-1,4-N-acetylgalactosaminyltransferase bre-4,Beta-1,4-galactosyltransferase 2,Beta-1,4-galactosyltransferase 5,Beta-1,4-galactosyltransferase 1,Beta-1,4-galactosyltransferase 3,Beta-1,4-galactosyltransferase 6 [Mytilus edulis]|uniref:Uncharacterized protein n=1 Tax=Mytilus edulis TaxID=6550 RepID=A0A8S3S145_MYTED|nr:Beta-1,4-galactosyltransferase 4,Beta-1,4-N-acetylgalactosaminyltransferase bre-4,Beta-1,4-galactosyltransferase 2,Beta-1,4-galactosyltransferase 5,Beta-1,4-galactosyltransferase 1,Beta-1,4-galactosyltransferase 3,Beta-1,4-galactosyltransferase 6 [Mytilus edulis]
MRPSTHVNTSSDISSKESMSRGDICECAGYSLDDSKRNILKAIQESHDSQPEQENPNSEYLKTNDRQDNVAVIASVKGSSRMMIDGMIEGSAITWKVDTGSRRTFITEQSYYSIMPECRPVLSRIDTQFETADGSTLNILGTAVMNISFGEFCAAFPIYVGGVKINLLGEDFISKYRCQWNFDSGSLDICGFTAPLEQDSVNVRSSRVIAMETIDIPARHEIIVKAKLTREVNAENNSEVFGILCPDSSFMRKYGLAIGRVLVNASRSHIYSRILNPCDTDIILYKGTHIGLFVPAQKIVSDIGLMEEETVCNVREMDTDPQEIPQYMAEMYSNGRENLTESEGESFKEILLKYRDIFYDPAGEPGKTTIGMHSIKLKEEIPVKEPPRRVPLYKRQAIEDEIKKLEDKKLIEKISDVCSFPPNGLYGHIPLNRSVLNNTILNMIHSYMDDGHYRPQHCTAVQKKSGMPFNRGMMSNVGFKEAMSDMEFDCIVFHDVDVLPEDDRNFYICSDNPIHMSVKVEQFGYRLPYEKIAGGIVTFSRQQFEEINGFSNQFFGWGGEDDDLYRRIKFNKYELIRPFEDFGMCGSVSHKPAERSIDRKKFLKYSYEVWKNDGLNNLEYRLLRKENKQLYRWIYVSI